MKTVWKGARVAAWLPLVCAAFFACSRARTPPVDERVLIDVGDTRLHAEIRGNDATNAPLLLYLHGGPGSPLGVPVFRAYGGRLLEEGRIVVYLHQRGIMKSPRVPAESHRVARYVEDVHRVIEYLGREYQGRKVDLLGHSWGGVLAYLCLVEHPDSARKLVTVGAPINAETMVRGRVERTLRWARETGNAEAIADLTPLRTRDPIEDAAEFEILARWTARAHGGWARNLSRDRIAAAVDYEGSISTWLEEQKPVEDLLLQEVLRLDLSEAIRSIRNPLLCIAGREDVDVPWEIVQEEIKSYGGPVDFRVFDNSHHMPFIDEEGAFVETVELFLDGE